MVRHGGKQNTYTDAFVELAKRCVREQEEEETKQEEVKEENGKGTEEEKEESL